MDLVEQLSSLCKNVEYLLEREKVLSEKVDDLLKLLPNEIKGHKAAGKLVGVCEHTMLRLVKAGQVPYKKHGRVVSYSLKDLIDYKDSRIIK